VAVIEFSVMVGVMLAAEVLLYREGLAEILQREPDFDVVGTAGSVTEVMDQLRDLDPDVVLLDAGLVGGLVAVAGIRSVRPHAKVVALAVSEAATDLLSWVRAGIVAFVSSDASIDLLVTTIRGTTHDESVCSPRLTARLLEGLAATPEKDLRQVSSDVRLTRREREVVGLLDLGKSNKEIAQVLSIAVPTVKNHVHNILEKLCVEGRGDVASALGHIASSQRLVVPV
jgi:two-component system nitrate/nitrite response regulator NarL